MESSISDYLSLWRPLGYLFIFLGMVFEGDLMLFTVYMLAFSGLLSLGMVTLTVFTGVFCGDVFWYWLGTKIYASNGSIGKIGLWIMKIVKPFDNHLHKRPFKTIFLSKFVYGIHHAILIRAGSLNLPAKGFIKIDIISNLLWVATIATLAYFSRASVSLVAHYIKYAEASLLIGVIAIIFLWHLISMVIKRVL